MKKFKSAGKVKYLNESPFQSIVILLKSSGIDKKKKKKNSFIFKI